MKEQIMLVCFNAYGYPHEKEFDENVRLKDVHQALEKICKTYIITGIYLTIKK